MIAARHNALLWWCLAASVVGHALLAAWLPVWHTQTSTPPVPLSVELREPPPRVEPPKLLPIEQPRPVVKERVKPVAVKPEVAKPEPVPVKPAPREERPPEPPRAPILTASPEAPPSPAAPVVPVAPVIPEQKSAPPPEPPRPPPVAAAPAPVTPPSYAAGYLRNPVPDYPEGARRRRESGTVQLRVVVTPEGKPASVTIEKPSGSTLLDNAARRAVEGWTFVPAREGNRPVQGVVIVPWKFTLPDE